MKTIILLFLSVIGATTTLKAQIPNADFENWTTTGTYSSPDGWDNLNAATSLMGTYTCMKGTPGTSGAAYIKLISKTITGMGVVPGIAASGKMDFATQKVTSGFPCSTRYKSLTGKWQYMASGSDQGFIDITLTRWNKTSGKREVIATTHNLLVDMAMSWTSFSIDLKYQSNATPDSAIIVLSASGLSPAANSYLYVDNLAFAGNVAGIEATVINTANINVYPNPASGNTLMITNADANMHFNAVKIMDMQGRELKQIQATITNQTLVDIADLAKGQYILLLSTNEGIARKSFIKL